MAAGTVPGELGSRHSSACKCQMTLGKSFSLSSPQSPQLSGPDAPIAKGPRCTGPRNSVRLQAPSHSLDPADSHGSGISKSHHVTSQLTSTGAFYVL